MIFSKYCIFFKLKPGGCLYHTLTSKKCYFSKDEINFVLDSLHKKNPGLLPAQIAKNLKDIGIIVDSLEDDESLLQFWRQQAQKMNQIKTLYLVLTESCNLNCTYCYQDGKSNRRMSSPTALEITKKFLAETSKDFNPMIFFYGGEPTLNLEALKQVTDYVISHKNTFHWSPSLNITTNGTLIDSRLASYFSKNNIFVAFSIDGPEEIHNLKRRYPNGKGTFKRVMKSVDYVKDAGGNFGISITVSDHNVDILDKIVEYFITEIEAKDISFQLLCPTTIGGEFVAPSPEHTAEMMIKAYDIMKDYGWHEPRLAKHISAFVKEEPCFSECEAIGSMVVAAPDGSLGNCLGFLNSRFGYHSAQNIEFLSDIYANTYFNPLKEIFKPSLERSYCESCSALGICGGGCYFSNYKMQNNDYFCRWIKFIQKWMIKQLNPY